MELAALEAMAGVLVAVARPSARPLQLELYYNPKKIHRAVEGVSGALRG